jgi:hypothetical protein
MKAGTVRQIHSTRSGAFEAAQRWESVRREPGGLGEAADRHAGEAAGDVTGHPTAIVRPSRLHKRRWGAVDISEIPGL